jgi:hypothetical protein
MRIQRNRANSFQYRTALPSIPQMLHTAPRINLSYECPQPIPLLLMARPVLCFLCSSSHCRLGLQAPALPGAAMQSPRWGVVQLVGHLTVNEDGEGSNPSAPANFSAGPGLTVRVCIKFRILLSAPSRMWHPCHDWRSNGMARFDV